MVSRTERFQDTEAAEIAVDWGVRACLSRACRKVAGLASAAAWGLGSLPPPAPILSDLA